MNNARHLTNRNGRVPPSPAPNAFGLTPEHVRALGLAVKAFERALKTAGVANTPRGYQTLTLAADALGRLERSVGR